MQHLVKDMDLNLEKEQLEMAEQIAMNVIHETYDCVQCCPMVNNEHLDRVYKATKILMMIKSMKTTK